MQTLTFSVWIHRNLKKALGLRVSPVIQASFTMEQRHVGSNIPQILWNVGWI